ncbi:MAG: hypothetical protein N2234_04820 [Planctomycetota bacterium]|nr:hypothetical protein [Planctomycetota bacterium]
MGRGVLSVILAIYLLVFIGVGLGGCGMEPTTQEDVKQPVEKKPEEPATPETPKTPEEPAEKESKDG